MKLLALSLILFSQIYASGAKADDLWDINSLITKSDLTPLILKQAQDTFNEAIKNPEIRMRNSSDGRGGFCRDRTLNFQSWMSKQKNIKSGMLDIACPSDNIHVVDRLSGSPHVFSGYHSTNIVLIKENDKAGIFVMDAQFSDGPIALQDYFNTVVQGRPLEPFIRRLHDHMPTTDEKNSPCRWSLYYRQSLWSTLFN
jgi:hypothetical protein